MIATKIVSKITPKILPKILPKIMSKRISKIMSEIMSERMSKIIWTHFGGLRRSRWNYVRHFEKEEGDVLGNVSVTRTYIFCGWFSEQIIVWLTWPDICSLAWLLLWSINFRYTGGPQLVRFLGTQQTALLEKPH